MKIFMSPITLINFFFERVWSKSEMQNVKNQYDELKEVLPKRENDRRNQISNAVKATVKLATDAENDEKNWQQVTDEAIKLAEKYKYRLYISISIHIIIFLDLVFLQKEQGMSLFPRAYKLIYYLASTLVFLIAKMFS